MFYRDEGRKNNMRKFILGIVFLLIIFCSYYISIVYAVEMSEDERAWSGFGFIENVELNRDPNYRKQEVTVNVPGYGLQKQMTYEYLPDRVEYQKQSSDIYNDLKEKNIVLYYYLQVFNPPFLNNILFTIITIMAAIGGFFVIGSFEGNSRLFVLILCIYAWGRVVGFLITSSLVGQGILSP